MWEVAELQSTQPSRKIVIMDKWLAFMHKAPLFLQEEMTNTKMKN